MFSFDFDTPHWVQMLEDAVIWLLSFGGIVFGSLYLNYWVASQPLRRREGARLFLDLIETGAKSGRGPAQTVVSISNTRDRSVGVWFHMVAGYLEQGNSFSEALAKVPRMIPAPMAAMMRAGERVGDLAKVLPACRQLVADGGPQTRAAVQFLLVFPVLGFPAGILILAILFYFVVPKFLDVAANIEGDWETGGGPGPFFNFVFHHQMGFIECQIALVLVIWSAAFLFNGGSRILKFLFLGLPPIADYIAYRIPWQRKRMQRDFSAMLAILLDSGVPEPEALTMAADCAANAVFTARAERAVAAMSRGVKLPEAVRMMDDRDEFQWRLAHAVNSGGGFVRALAGWNEALDARAFRQEQAAAQILSTGAVLLNGLFVGLIAIGVFQFLSRLIDRVADW